MDKNKIPCGINVYQASTLRLEWVFDTFSQVCLSFSGGKDSTVLFHMVAAIARKRKKKISVLFIDWEVQFSHTIEHVKKMKELYQDVTNEFYWVALPLKTVNGVSQIQPEWISWEPNIPWVRSPPEFAITNKSHFSFYRYPMTFEEFVRDFGYWFAGRKSTAMLIGIRTDESLNRYMSIATQRKLRYADDKPWTTASPEGTYYTAYPIYDWKIRDIWVYHSHSETIYNPLYDLMYRAGLPLKNMRICEPFGPEQRKGLWLYHVLDAAMWVKACSRVSGAVSGAIYANESGGFYAVNKKMQKPTGYTWQSYALYLLDSMPQQTAEHYRNKIFVYIRWCEKHGYPKGIPEEQDNDTGYKDIPSWRRICKTIIRNDYWCKALSFSPNKSHTYDRYKKRIEQKRKEWGTL